MITIQVTGEFYSVVGNLKTMKQFSEVVKAPSLEFFKEESRRYMGTDDKGNLKYELRSFLNVRGKMKKELLPQLLKRKYTDFVRVRKCSIEKIEGDVGLELPITLMSREQIGELVKAKKMPMDVNEYMSIDDLRTDVMMYLEDAEIFLQTYKAKRDKLKLDKEYLELNGLVDTAPVAISSGSTAPVSISSGSTHSGVKKAKVASSIVE